MQSIEHKIPSFLLTLRQMIEVNCLSKRKNQNQTSIGWSNGGKDFIIRDPSRFSEQTLPGYFRHSNLSSFIRQLNIYHFKKLSNQKDPNQYVYHHNYFCQDQPQKMVLIKRKHKRNPNLKPEDDSFDNPNDDSCRNPYYDSYGNPSHDSRGNPNYDSGEIPIEEEHNEQVLEKKKQCKSDSIDTFQRKKVLDKEIYQLEQYLNILSQSTSTLSKQKNTLQIKVSETIQSHRIIKQSLSNYLIKSYQQQYLKYSSIIQNQLKQQQGMFRDLWTKGQDNTIPSIMADDNRERKDIQCENLKRRVMQHNKVLEKERVVKKDYSCYNSTSSGGDGPRRTLSYHSNNLLNIKHIHNSKINPYSGGIINQAANQILLKKSSNGMLMKQSQNQMTIKQSQNESIMRQEVNKIIDLGIINGDIHHQLINKSINNHERQYETEQMDSDYGNNLCSKTHKKVDQQHKQKNHNKFKQQCQAQTRWRRILNKKHPKDSYHGERDIHPSYFLDGEQLNGNRGRSIIISYSPKRGFGNESVVQLGRRQQKTNHSQQLFIRPRIQCQIVQIKTDDYIYHSVNNNQ